MRLSTLSTGCFFCGFCPPEVESRCHAGTGPLCRHALDHGMYGIAVSAQMQPGRIPDPRNQSPVRAQSRRDQQRMAGKVLPTGQTAAFQHPFPPDHFDGLGADKTNGEFRQTPAVS